MGELTAQITERGRAAKTDAVARRRKLAHDVRAAREKLTSSIGLERVFDYEFVRLFAEYRMSASALLFGLTLTIAAVSTFWVPLQELGLSFALVLGAIGLMGALSQRFLRQNPEDV